LFPVQHAVPLGQLLFVLSKQVAIKLLTYTQCPVPSLPAMSVRQRSAPHPAGQSASVEHRAKQP
jgi:hypothetical protein